MNKISVALLLMMALAAPAAFAVDADYSSVTGAIVAGAVVTAIGVIAGTMMLPRAAKWGYRQVMSMLGR